MSVIKVNNITNRDGTSGPVIAGIATVSSTSHMVVPTGRTGQRYADDGENIVRDGLVLYLDAKYSYPSKTGIGTTTSGAAAPAGSSTDVDVNTWYDMSGNEYNLTLINGVGYNNSNGGYLIFDGINDYAQSVDLVGSRLSNPLDNVLSYTFFANVLSSSSYYLISTGGQTGQAAGIAFSYQAGAPFIMVKGLNGGFNYDIPVGNFPTNQWIGWGVVCDGNTLSAYKNGVFLGSQTTKNMGAVSADNFTTLTLGVPNNNLSNAFIASMQFSNLQIYNKALSAAEVLQNYNVYKSRFGLS
jgi:hypothetical protein